MPNNKYIFTDGHNAKTVDAINDSWDFVEAMKQAGNAELYAKVAAVFRAMNLTADAVANMPFALVKGGEDFDTSADWQNKVGFMPKPQELIRLWRLSLFMSNKAYGRMITTKEYKGKALSRELVYVVPDTMEIITNEDTGTIDRIQRKINGRDKESYSFPRDRNLVRFWRLDHTTELLPSANSEFMALANAAGILHAADWWTELYFRRGAIRPLLVALKGMVMGDKKEELQSSWSRFMRGLGNSWAELSKVINAETMEVKQIGDGLGDIKDSPVYRQAIENVAMASGIPLSLLLSNSASYATAQSEYSAWFRDSITPWSKWIAEVLNDQLFRDMGYTFEFRTEQAEPSQEEEVQRAQAFSVYVSALAGHPKALSIAAQIVGIDLPADMDYEELDEKSEEPKEPEKEPVTKPMDMEETDEPEEEPMTAKAWEELDNWKTKATRYAKRGKPVTFEFVTESIGNSTADLIRKRLQFAGTPEEVKAAFDVGKVETVEPSEIKLLADALNKAAEAIQ